MHLFFLLIRMMKCIQWIGIVSIKCLVSCWWFVYCIELIYYFCVLYMFSDIIDCLLCLISFTTTVDSDEESEMSEVIILLVTFIVTMYKLAISHLCDILSFN